MSQKHSFYNKPIQHTWTISLRAENWITMQKSRMTYLYNVMTPGGWFGTDDNVPLYKHKMNNKYLFQIFKCNGSGPIKYGDKVRLRSLNTGLWIQCGAGTCNGHDNGGSCGSGDWQVFTINSLQGKRGYVYYDDLVDFRQIVGNRCAITPADGSRVWCTDSNDRNNETLRILPDNGSIYVDPQSEMDEYNKIRKDLFAQQNPLAAGAADFRDGFANIFGDLGSFVKYGVIISFIMFICLFFMIILTKIA